MVDMQDLESILNGRTVPEPRSNLENRIIEMAANHRSLPQKSSLWADLSGILAGFWEGFLLPAPVLSMVFVVCLGIYVGLTVQPAALETVAVNEAVDAEMYSYFEIAYNADYGDRI